MIEFNYLPFIVAIGLVIFLAIFSTMCHSSYGYQPKYQVYAFL